MSATTVLRRADHLAVMVERLERSALQHGGPVEDLLLMACNLCGIYPNHDRRWAPLSVQLARGSGVPRQVAVPLNAEASLFQLHNGETSLRGELVAYVEHIDSDEAVGGRFRDGGRAAAPNPNAHTRCTGCARCRYTNGGSEKAFAAYPHTVPLSSAAIQPRSGSMAARRLGHESRLSASRIDAAASRRLERLP